MNWINIIIDFSLRRRKVVAVAAIVLIFSGLWCARHMSIDVFPDLTAPTVVVMTDARGMTAEEVERLVTMRIETEVNGATDVRRVRSASMQGYSFVWIEFDWYTDVYRARQTVAEKISSVGAELPRGVVPVLAPQSSVMGEILFIGLQSDTTSLMELRTIADWVVKPAILSTGGVSQVTNIGGQVKEYQIVADPLRMSHYGVTMFDIERAGCSFGANSSGGVVRDYGNEYALRGIAQTTDLEQLGQTLVKLNDGQPVTLSDVSQVRVGAAQKMGCAAQDARPAVILSVSKQPNINTLEVTERIEQSLKALTKTLPADVRLDTHIFRQADFIESSVSNVGSSLFEGALFAVVVLFVFLNSCRTTLISVVAIPLSLLGTCVVLYLLGMEINTMTLGGMCIAIGSLVDDAIIDVENVYKRLRQNHLRPEEERCGVLKVVFEASKEIRASIMNATMIIVVAFVPLFFLDGMEGRMLRPLGVAYIIALLMSLATAMTVTPMLCSCMLGNANYLTRNRKDSWTSTFISTLYRRLLARVLQHGKIVVSASLTMVLAAVVLLFAMGRSFLPDFNEGSAVITAVAQPGVSVDVSDELGQLLERALLDIPEVKSTARRTGRDDLDEHSQATNSSEIEVRFVLEGRSRQSLFEEMRQKMSAVPGVLTAVGQPLGHRIDHMLSGTRANIAIKVFGPELSHLTDLGAQVQSAIADIDGLVDVSVEQQTETPQIQIRANRAAMARRGIGVDEFNRFIELAFGAEKVADVYEGQRKVDVVVKLSEDYTKTLDGVRNTLIDCEVGGKVPLSEVADIVSVGGPNVIMREKVERRLVVSANVSGRDVGSAVEEIEHVINQKIVLPDGYRIEYGGQFESAKSAAQTLAVTTLIALIIIFLLLCCEFENMLLACIVLLNLPFALIGGVVAIGLTNSVVSIPSIIGFITLFGIATRNGILLISKYLHLQQHAVDPEVAIVEGAVDRLNPILMTALTSALALVPLVLNSDKAGNEIQSPMAVVVLGGLLTSTVLNIFVMPLVYQWFTRKKQNK